MKIDSYFPASSIYFLDVTICWDQTHVVMGTAELAESCYSSDTDRCDLKIFLSKNKNSSHTETSQGQKSCRPNCDQTLRLDCVSVFTVGGEPVVLEVEGFKLMKMRNVLHCYFFDLVVLA